MRNALKSILLFLVCIGCTLSTVPGERLSADEALTLVEQDSGFAGHGVFGMEFVANSDIEVVSLGFLDWHQNGLGEDHPVGLWDLSENLLASTTVTTDDPLVGGFRYADISPITLTAGETYIVGSFGIGIDIGSSSGGSIFNVSSLIEPTCARFHSGGQGLVFPETTFSSFYYTTASFRTSNQTGPIFSLTDIGDLPGGNDFSRASGINESGQVCGSSESENGERGILWDGSLTDLGELPGGENQSRAIDIDNFGRVTGGSLVGSGTFDFHAFLWEDGTMIDLGTLPGDVISWGSGINSNGQIVGFSAGENLNPFRAILWENGVMTELGDGTPDGSGSSQAHDINEAGQIVGFASSSVFPGRPVLWENGNIIDLGVFSSNDIGRALAINEDGTAVGWIDPPAGGGGGARRAIMWRNGDVINLGAFLGSTSAEDINNSEQIVGDAGDDEFPFYWDENIGFKNLNDLVDDTANGWTLVSANGINEAGQIVGSGINPDGVTRGFVLNPVLKDVLLGDVNLDGEVNLLDVAPFVDLLTNGEFQAEADINEDGVVNLLDVAPFVDLLSGG